LRTPQINLDQLVTFYLVAKERGLTAAAKILNVTPPAVTTQIKNLEQRFAVKLIKIDNKRCTLTKAGELLVPYAEQIYQRSIQAEDLLSSYRNSLRIGISAALTFRLVPIIDSFNRQFPEIKLTLGEGRSRKILEELNDFKHDVAVIATSGSVPDEFTLFRIPGPDSMVLVVSPNSSLSKEAEPTWQMLEMYPIIVFGEGSMLRQLVVDEFKKRNIRMNLAASADSVEGLKLLVEKGIGAAFIPRGNVAQEAADHKLNIVPFESGIKLWIDIVFHKDSSLSPPLRAFLGFVERDLHCKMADY
jgi:DNA-binding transcriptional LysR family regulator